MGNNNGDTILKVEDLSLTFGNVHALNNVSLDVRDGEVLAVIGPNGAGKTCLLNCLSGFYHPQSGIIHFEGRDISNVTSHKRAALGMPG